MELTLSNDEVTAILIAWANEQFKAHMDFNKISMDTGYSTIRRVTISHVEPEQA